MAAGKPPLFNLASVVRRDIARCGSPFSMTRAQALPRESSAAHHAARAARRAASGERAHSIANALATIATGLLSAALVSVTRPKLMVRPSRTTRASASTSDEVAARMKCVV
jgi:hypothetical protein